MPTMLSAIPPTALCSAIVRMRSLMWNSSSTLVSEVVIITAPAASEVMSLLGPKATPTVAARSAGASLMPSPTNSVRLPRLRLHDRHLLLGRLAGMHLGDSHLLRQIAHL